MRTAADLFLSKNGQKDPDIVRRFIRKTLGTSPPDDHVKSTNTSQSKTAAENSNHKTRYKFQQTILSLARALLANENISPVFSHQFWISFCTLR